MTEIWDPRGKTTLLRKYLKEAQGDSFAESLETTILGPKSWTHGSVGSDLGGGEVLWSYWKKNNWEYKKDRAWINKKWLEIPGKNIK